MVDEDLRIRMIRLGIGPSRIALRAWTDAVKKKEQELALNLLNRKDPRMTAADLRSRSPRTRRLRGI